MAWLELMDPDLLADVLTSAIMRVKGWRAYRRHYSAAERREHRRQLEADRLTYR